LVRFRSSLTAQELSGELRSTFIERTSTALKERPIEHSRGIANRTADRVNDVRQVHLLGRIDVNPRADVERWELSELAKAREDVRSGRVAIEVAGMSSPLNETVRGDLQLANAVNVNQVVRRNI
jgi:hypothetical protein